MRIEGGFSIGLYFCKWNRLGDLCILISIVTEDREVQVTVFLFVVGF